MVPWNAIELIQTAFRLAPEILYTIYVVHLISKALAVVDPEMPEFR